MIDKRSNGLIYVIFCWLYLLLGMISIGVGVLLMRSPALFVHGPGRPERVINLFGILFIVFGAVRILNAGAKLWRLGRSR